jgi:hypothetical protein
MTKQTAQLILIRQKLTGVTTPPKGVSVPRWNAIIKQLKEG